MNQNSQQQDEEVWTPGTSVPRLGLAHRLWLLLQRPLNHRAILLVAITLIIGAGGLYGGLRMLSATPADTRESTPSLGQSPERPELTYREEQLGISFEYPATLQVDAQRETLSDGTTVLYLSFSSGQTVEYGEPERTDLAISSMVEKQPGEQFEAALRRKLRDPNGLLVIESCSLGKTASPCLEVKDQREWQASVEGGIINTLVYFDGPAYIYGMEPGHANTMQIIGTGLERALVTLRFDR